MNCVTPGVVRRSGSLILARSRRATPDQHPSRNATSRRRHWAPGAAALASSTAVAGMDPDVNRMPTNCAPGLTQLACNLTSCCLLSEPITRQPPAFRRKRKGRRHNQIPGNNAVADQTGAISMGFKKALDDISKVSIVGHDSAGQQGQNLGILAA